MGNSPIQDWVSKNPVFIWHISSNDHSCCNLSDKELHVLSAKVIWQPRRMDGTSDPHHSICYLLDISSRAGKHWLLLAICHASYKSFVQIWANNLACGWHHNCRKLTAILLHQHYHTRIGPVDPFWDNQLVMLPFLVLFRVAGGKPAASAQFILYPDSSAGGRAGEAGETKVKNMAAEFLPTKHLFMLVRFLHAVPTALHPLRRKSCYGLLSPLKIHRPRLGFETANLGSRG
jgi:hypothetical protein